MQSDRGIHWDGIKEEGQFHLILKTLSFQLDMIESWKFKTWDSTDRR